MEKPRNRLVERLNKLIDMIENDDIYMQFHSIRETEEDSFEYAGLNVKSISVDIEFKFHREVCTESECEK